MLRIHLLFQFEKYLPMGKLNVIKGHKLGPVYAVSKAYDFILDDQPVILNYCDFFMNWTILFKLFIESSNCDGAIPCYTGFHHTYFIIIIYTQAVKHEKWNY